MLRKLVATTGRRSAKKKERDWDVAKGEGDRRGRDEEEGEMIRTDDRWKGSVEGRGE
jgi:hypothetical protein